MSYEKVLWTNGISWISRRCGPYDNFVIKATLKIHMTMMFMIIDKAIGEW